MILRDLWFECRAAGLRSGRALRVRGRLSCSGGRIHQRVGLSRNFRWLRAARGRPGGLRRLRKRRRGTSATANDAAPGVCAVSVDVLVLGRLDSLQEGLAQICKCGDLFGFDFALRGEGKDFAERTGEITGGEQFAGEPGSDVAANLISDGGLSFFFGVKIAEMRMIGTMRGAAAASVSESERTHRDSDL